ncbi:MAG: GntR family transcriptional regulator [Anaerolineae bacterium]
METQLFDRIQPRTLRAEIVDILRDAIVSGRLKPGEHLKESTIAEQMSVSRIPVREAFRQLEQEGLILSIPNQGSFVKVFDEKDIKEIFTLRAALESLACELVLSDGTLQTEDMEHLESLIQQQREAIDARDFDRLTKLDMDFHEFICKKSGSERLLKTWRSLRAQVQVLFHQRFRTYDWIPQTVETDHATILNALRQGDIHKVAQVHKEINARVAGECIQMLHPGQEQSS